MDASDGLSFTATIERAPSGAAVLALNGEVDVFSSERFRDVLAEACADERQVCIDLNDVPFVDTTALAALLRARRILRDQGGMLVLARANDTVSRVIRQAGLDALMPLFDTLDEAFAHLAERP